MKAVKGNKEYTISDTEKRIYIAQGYDIINDDGEIISYGAGKTVSYEKYVELEKENLELKKELEFLKSEPPVENEGEKTTSRAKK